MSDGSRHSLYAVKEAAHGVTPNDPALDLIRITGTTLGLAKDSLQSEEIRSDRQIADFRLGANKVLGDINFELSYTSFDQFLEAVLLSADWASPATTGTITMDATLTGFSRLAGDFVADGFKVGQVVESLGYAGAGAEGRFLLTAVVALSITASPLEGQIQIAEAGAGDESLIAAESVVAEATRRSFSMVRHFADLSGAQKPYYIYRGVEINTMTLAIAANAVITGTFGVIGKSQELAEDLTGLGTPTFPAASTTSPLDSFTGTLEEAGTAIAVITEISLNLQNGLEPRFVVGSKNSILPSVGRSNLTGQITAYFEDSSLVTKFVDEIESSIVFSLPDDAGNMVRFTIPRIKYTGGQPDVAGEGPITLSMPFQSLLDTAESSNIRIERLPV